LKKWNYQDQNKWFTQFANREMRQIEGPVHPPLVDEFGEELMTHWIKVRRAMTDTATAGGLGPTHFREFKLIV